MARAIKNMENRKQKESVISGVSILRILATVGVVCLHTNSTIVENPSLFEISDNQWHFFDACHMIWNWCVPVFFMITGALLLKSDRIIDYKLCLEKYCKRVLLALVLFGIPFALLILIGNGEQGISLAWKPILYVLEGKSFSHLWYLYALLGVYLILPVVKSFISKNDDNELKFLIVLLMIFSVVIPSINQVFDLHVISFFSMWYPLFYVLVGYYIMWIWKGENKYGIFLVVIILTVTWFVLSYHDVPMLRRMDYNNFLIVVESVLVFCLFKNIDISSDLVWKLDRLCFGVYLIHPVFIHFTYRVLKITPMMFGDRYGYIIAVWIFAIVFAIISFVCSWIMNLIGPLKRYVL